MVCKEADDPGGHCVQPKAAALGLDVGHRQLHSTPAVRCLFAKAGPCMHLLWANASDMKHTQAHNLSISASKAQQVRQLAQRHTHRHTLSSVE